MAGMRVYRWNGKTDEFMGETREMAGAVRKAVKASDGYYVGPDDKGMTLTSATVTSLSVEASHWDEFTRYFPLKGVTTRTATTTTTCHYCGQPATGFGVFGEPACTECGGH